MATMTTAAVLQRAKIPTMEERRAMARDAADSAVREAQATASAQRSLQQRQARTPESRDQGTGSSSSDTTSK